MTDHDARALKGLLIQAGVFLVTLAAADAVLARYGPRHFLPEQKLAAVAAAPEVGVVFLGDSRMVAGLDFRVLRDRFGRRGVTLPLSDLTLGAVDAPNQAVVFRALRRARPAMSGLVLGVSGDSLLASPDVTNPDLLVGNAAVGLSLSRGPDVFVSYPGFPLRRLDPGIRFSLNRLSALGSYKSLLWIVARRLQDSLAGRTKGPGAVNQFGLVGDMADLANDFRSRTGLRFRYAQTATGWRLDPWVARLRDDLRRSGTPLVLVEVPMPAEYRGAVTLSPDGRALRRWLAEQCAADGGRYIDLSDGLALGLTDDDFPDHLHLGPEGARRFSRVVGDRLALFFAEFAARPTPAPVTSGSN
jgi:hypothetical protein